MTELTVRVVTEADIRDFAAWRHEAPYDVYNITGDSDKAVEYFLRPSTNCHVLVEDGELAGFFTFGFDAQVPGGDYSTPARDIGLGVKPSRTGQGLGRGFAGAVVEYARDGAERLRVTIATGNRRAVRVWSGMGFTEIQRFESPQTVMGSNEFVVLESP